MMAPVAGGMVRPIPAPIRPRPSSKLHGLSAAPGVRLRFVATEDLYEEHLVGMVAAGHPLTRGRVNLRRLAAPAHITVSRQGRFRGALDSVLEEHGLSRRIAAVVPRYTSAARLILTSDLPPLSIQQGWHIRYDSDPAHQWLRGQLRQAMNAS
jgi:hypothetical protein